MRMNFAFALMALASLGGALAFAPPVRPAVSVAVSPRSRMPASVRMGNNAPVGIFTPVVTLGKQVLGEKTFNKVRGKLISVHSQVIGYFCTYTGTPRRMNQLLIKKAKTNGGRLGFLN
ncbi:hypothetical protein T492DRAFT_940056 [Pavlovales sp. CCMP2436]|nr:hypothetical protein T492DRAFT_940056 [Pavlovales sp. CCMP2436]